MEIEIFVGERGYWVVVKYPEITKENHYHVEMLQEAENERGDTVDTETFPPGLHKVRTVIHAEKSHYELSIEDDVWLEFEPIS